MVGGGSVFEETLKRQRVATESDCAWEGIRLFG